MFAALSMLTCPLPCYDWRSAMKRKGHVIGNGIAVISPEVCEAALAFELARTGMQGIPVGPGGVLSW